jgi:hypothetical protein
MFFFTAGLSLYILLAPPVFGEQRSAKNESVNVAVEENHEYNIAPKLSPTSFGGYGEIHFNETSGTGGDYLDIHRFVFFMAHSFSDWITLHSELEIEHAYAATGRGGEILFEQLQMEFEFCESMGLRMGRILAPLGIINKTHEPATFNGVERPGFAKYLIPSTWSLDGVGVYGKITDQFAYEIYLTNGLNGAGFTGQSGLREGRLHERPSWNQNAVTGRIDYYLSGMARIGWSFFSSGVNNGNKGVNPGIDEDVKTTIQSLDVQTSWKGIDLKVVAASVNIANVEKLNEFLQTQCGDECSSNDVIGSQMMGSSAELAVHVLPESLMTGKLDDSDLITFVRLDHYNTHASMASGDVADGAYDRSVTTFGLTFKPVSTVAIKLDRQVSEDATEADKTEVFNVGLGWQF